MTPVVAMLYGAAAMGSLVAMLFFVRYWRDSRDRFHLYFASALALFAANWVVVVAIDLDDETRAYAYLLRLLGFLLILVGIVDKNRRARG